ncbi:diacylglycerol O-acyltransferase KNAG_0G02570 [Huiozyma naganishii CBS 8797]|uniref:Diacylglycerol O-acyltransferase n=1 Tax=Huiozyma naganishii (strain ATCC MYA-139 / BCRC 22969 / CBS 8797 / KCTC 17520 / NBRC 10181 / NCYC 3082 / Yp74L-3) TaxID=1071383 RepID=J7RNW1_HUIN7|nr:hypothetical protein KNAG_0G02570 [Kazachstania naganishii CBS 8797]CCK71313.1 hypothetical protein KNAG_0G02570 [Kazachstania naganishii CBS 8797]
MARATGFEHHEGGETHAQEAAQGEIRDVRPVLSPKPSLQYCCSIRVPLRRRLQTLAVTWHISSFVLFIVVTLYLISVQRVWPILIPYAVYYFVDRTPANGRVRDRFSPWFRSLPLWRYICEYFPITIHKTADLPPTFEWDGTYKRNWFWFGMKQKQMVRTGPRYIFGYHPHGVGAIGAFGTFATEGCGWSRLFPGICTSLLTLVTQFHIPFYRDYLLALGICSVSRKNALKVLADGQSICIVVGGVRESLLGSDDAFELILNKRKGFIKLALETGNASLVPVFAFGETDCFKMYETEEGSILHKFQFWIKKYFGFSVPIFFARGLFNYDFGLVPFRTPLDIVIGKPIHIRERYVQPNPELIDHYHALYVESLKKMYYEHRAKFGCENTELHIVG